MPFTFGTEIECLIPNAARSSLATKIEATGLRCLDIARYHSGLNRTAWKIEADGSLRADPGYATIELVSPPMPEGNPGFEQIEKVCRVLGEVDAMVNRSCGLHVHVGIAATPVKAVRKLAELYAKHEMLIDQLIPPSRRANSNPYCASVATRCNFANLARATTVRDISYALTGDHRHSKLNLSSYWRYSTVEFRHHSGTVDATKIIKWASFCMKMVDTAIRTADESGPIPADAPRVPWGWWRKGKRRRMIFQMLSRPEGVTNEELRIALGRRTEPGLRSQVELANVENPGDERWAFRAIGIRGGYEVLRFLSVADVAIPASATPSPTTLDELYDLMALADEDKEFWKERQQILAAGTSRRRQPRPHPEQQTSVQEVQDRDPTDSSIRHLLYGRDT